MATKTPEEILNAFDSAIQQFSQFRLIQRRSGEPLTSAIVEAQTRLEQAFYLLRRFHELEGEHREKNDELRRGNRERHDALAAKVYALGTAIRLHGEAFYYFAFRARDAFRSIPGFDFDFDAKGVRNARNHMIEHSDGKHGVMVSWWQFDCPEGLILNPQSQVGQSKWSDPGLYPNAEEFIDKLTSQLRSVLSAGSDPGTQGRGN